MTGDTQLPGQNIPTSISVAAATALAVASGTSFVTQYAVQPALATIASDFGVVETNASQIVTAVMGGYLIGLFLLVPLADRWPPRRLIPTQLSALALVLCAGSLSTNLGTLIAVFALVGLASTVAAQAVAVVGRFTAPGVRGNRVGIVLAGNSAGILLSRFMGGALTNVVGWRMMLVCFAVALIGTAILCAYLLPSAHPAREAQRVPSYRANLRSLPRLLRTSASLRIATWTGMLWFSAFNLVWVGLSLALASAPYHLSPAQIGLYSLVGVLGLAVTGLAGNLTDVWGSRRVLIICLAGSAIGAMILLFGIGIPWLCLFGLAIFDAGCFGAQASNQAVVVSLNPQQSGRFNSVYLTLYYTAGAIGAASVTPILSLGGWEMVAALGAILTAGGAVVQWRFAQRQVA